MVSVYGIYPYCLAKIDFLKLRREALRGD